MLCWRHLVVLRRPARRALIGALLALSIAHAQEPVPEYVAYESEDLGLAIRLPETLAAVSMRTEGLVARKWTGEIGRCPVDLLLLIIERDTYGIEEPEEVNEAWQADLRDPKKAAGSRITFGEQECIPGTFGWAGHAAFVRGRVEPARGLPTGMFMLSGLQSKRAWTLRVSTAVDPEADDARAIRELLVRAVNARGPARDPRWSKEEIRKLWQAIAPESTRKKLEAPVRSGHYIVQADCPNTAALSLKLEQHYATVEKILAIPDVPTRRLMPAYLFRTKDEYTEVYMKTFQASREIALEQSGHLQGIYYITYFEDLDDPNHLYQAARQILRARLRLDQSAWFSEGFAKYVATRPTERSLAAHLVKIGEHVPLAELVHVSSLLLKTRHERVTGADLPERRVMQAALLVEFLRESKWSKGRFPAFAHAVGVVPSEDRPGLEDALRSVFDTDFAGFEKQWIDYCKKR